MQEELTNTAFPAKKTGDSLPRPEKKIADTWGGKIVNFFTFYVVGFVLNSTLSLGITYGLNPRPEVKTFKDRATEVLTHTFGGTNTEKVSDNLRSGIEIGFMFIAGIIATTLMTPLTRYSENIGYKINQVIGKDTDILPEEMRPVPEAQTIGQHIEQQIESRVKKHSASDLWKSRVVSMAGVMGGDYLINNLSRSLEKDGKQSVDTLSWRAGMQLYKILPEKLVTRWNKWFSEHGASIGDIKKNMAEHFSRLQNTELKYGNSQNGIPNTNSMVLGEQGRLVIKELAWTLTLALFVDKLTGWFKKDRLHHQRHNAIAELQQEGMIPEGYSVKAHHHGVEIKTEPGAETDIQYWREKTGTMIRTIEKTENYVTAREQGLKNSQLVTVG